MEELDTVNELNELNTVNEMNNTNKVWSEKQGRYYYKPKDKNYFNEYFHRTKKVMTCDICGRTVTCQMYSHIKSKRCIAVKREKELIELREQLNGLTQNVTNL